ncbi:PilN domain-containing protein [bacterium]|nr:PilN domain-containing protein [bacterium]MBU1615614.1 PilN domain-containing protein [bacterium]
MTRINLLPPDYGKQAKTRRILILLGFIPVLILVGFGVHYLVKLDEKKIVLNDTANYEAKIKELQPIVDEMDRLAAKEEKMGKKIRAINSLSKGKHAMVHLFEEINSLLPENLWLKGFTKQEGKNSLSFSGTAMSNFEVAQIMIELMKSPYFDKVELKVIRETTVDQFKIKDFEVTCELKEVDEGV